MSPTTTSSYFDLKAATLAHKCLHCGRKCYRLAYITKDLDKASRTRIREALGYLTEKYLWGFPFCDDTCLYHYLRDNAGELIFAFST